MNPLHFALVVAIWRYPGGLPELNGPLNDAEDFLTWVRDPGGGGVAKENVRSCFSPTEGELDLGTASPRKADVDLSLDELRHQAWEAVAALPETERPGARASTRLYVFVAGHGVMPEGGSGALLDALARPGARSHLDLGKYVQWLAQDGSFGEVIVFADCCRNYEPLVEARGPDLDRAAELGVRVVHLIGHATTGGAEAFEDPDFPLADRRGLFSRALMDGLRGAPAAVHPGKGYVTPGRLHEYVKDRVKEATRHRPPHWQQDVDTVGNFDLHDMALGPRREVVRHSVVLHLPTTLTGEVRLVGPDGSPMFWDASRREWPVHLYDGLWRIEPGEGLTGDGAFHLTAEVSDVYLR